MVTQDVVLFKKNGQNGAKIGPERDSDVRNGNEMRTGMSRKFYFWLKIIDFSCVIRKKAVPLRRNLVYYVFEHTKI